MVSINNKKILHILYTGSCNIYEFENFIDDSNKTIKQKLILKYQNIPCRASYYNNSLNIASSKENTFNNILTQKVKLFLDNNIYVKAGSIVELTQNGRTNKYKNSGEPAIYSNHQEIMLDIFEYIC